MKMLPLRKAEDKRTATEKTVRNCVFMFVIVYVALLTYLFLNTQINVVNAESDLVSVTLSSNFNLPNTDSVNADSENSNNDLLDSDLVDTRVEL